LACSTLEDFSTSEHFNLGYAVHCLYYVDNMRATLQRLQSLTGKMIIVHHGERGINEVHQNFGDFIRKGPNIMSTHENVLTNLTDLGINYTCEVYPTQTNISACKDPSNLIGKNMIRFFLDQPNLSQEELLEVSKYFKRLGRDYMTHDMALIITK
jgi:hypothetical protein